MMEISECGNHFRTEKIVADFYGTTSVESVRGGVVVRKDTGPISVECSEEEAKVLMEAAWMYKIKGTKLLRSLNLDRVLSTPTAPPEPESAK